MRTLTVIAAMLLFAFGSASAQVVNLTSYPTISVDTCMISTRVDVGGVIRDINGVVIDSCVGRIHYIFNYKKIGPGVECVIRKRDGFKYYTVTVFLDRMIVSAYAADCKITKL